MNNPTDTVIFTDGSSRGNPGPGGWGSVLVIDAKEVIELGGGEAHTTNNRMELAAAIGGLTESDQDSKITIYTDSSYVINGITKWIKGWKKNGWMTKTKKEVMNSDLWGKLDDLSADRDISWKYVGGHVGILGNERCDHIATSFADGMKISLYDGPLAAYDLPKALDISLDPAKLAAKKSTSSHSSAKAYSYVSMVGGVIEVHHSWAECEKRVKGARGAKYRKSTSIENEQVIMGEFGAF